jgi:phage tail-like protein
MARARSAADQPVSVARFEVEIAGVAGKGALEVLFPEARISAGGGLGRHVEYGLLTLRRAVAASSAWYDWWDESRGSPQSAARDVAVTALGPGGAPTHRWRFAEAAPVAYHLSSLDALGEGLLIETLELAVQHFTAEHLR